MACEYQIQPHLTGQVSLSPKGDWKATFRSSDVNPDFFVYRPKDLDEQLPWDFIDHGIKKSYEQLPWDFIDHGIKKSYLKEEYNLALESIESPPCNVGDCTRCGVCD
jgi:hypothetical protein